MAKLDRTLVEAAIELLESRFPESEGIAAAIRTDDGQILTSVVFEPEWWSQPVEIAVPDPNDPTKWVSKTLGETQPYYWANVYKRNRKPFNR